MGNNCCPLPATPTTLPPSGPAGGDLNGTYPNPQVDPLKVAAEVAASASAQAALAQSLSAALAKYYPAAPTALPPSGPAGGDLTGTYPNPQFDPQKIAAEVAGSTAAQAALAQALSGSLAKYYPTSLAPSGAAGGDLTGTYPNPTVDPLKLANSIAGNDTATSALADALCKALTCCIQESASAGTFDPEKIAGVFRDCLGNVHAANDQLPTCAQMENAIIAAVNGVNLGSYLFSPAFNPATHVLTFQTEDQSYDIDLSSLLVNISKDKNNAIVTGSDGGLFVPGPEKYYNASCIVGRGWDNVTRVPETGSGWQTQDINTGYGGFCGHTDSYVSWIDGCLVLQPGVYGGVCNMFQYNVPLDRNNTVYVSADAIDSGGSQRISIGSILTGTNAKQSVSPISFAIDTPSRMRIVYTPYGTDWNMDLVMQLFCSPL